MAMEFHIRTSTDGSLEHMMREAFKLSKHTDELITVYVTEGRDEVPLCAVYPDGDVLLETYQRGLIYCEHESDTIALVKSVISRNKDLRGKDQLAGEPLPATCPSSSSSSSSSEPSSSS